jgi:hypothetical protein
MVYFKTLKLKENYENVRSPVVTYIVYALSKLCIAFRCFPGHSNIALISDTDIV